MLTLCDGQLAVPTSNCTLCGYVLECYSAFFVCLSHTANVCYFALYLLLM